MTQIERVLLSLNNQNDVYYILSTESILVIGEYLKTKIPEKTRHKSEIQYKYYIAHLVWCDIFKWKYGGFAK
jgi:hypothetical protein